MTDMPDPTYFPPLALVALKRVMGRYIPDAAASYAASGKPPGHVYEDLGLLARWLNWGDVGGTLHLRAFLPDPARPGTVTMARSKSVGEVISELSVLTDRDWVAGSGAGDLGRAWPPGRITVSPHSGADYLIDVTVINEAGAQSICQLALDVSDEDTAGRLDELWSVVRQVASLFSMA